MNSFGYIKTAAITPTIKVADTVYNASQIISLMKEAYAESVSIMVFPELCITGYTCQDLFCTDVLIDGAIKALKDIREASKGMKSLIFVGFPLSHGGKLYNTAAVLSDGKILAFIPKHHLPQYSEFYEMRHFTPGDFPVTDIDFEGEMIPFGMNILFKPGSAHRESAVIACELCEDLWAPNPPCGEHALHGANIIVNLSASNDVVGKNDYRRLLLESTSARYLCGYIYANAGEGESTQDLVFAGERMIAENGRVLYVSDSFTDGITIASIDTKLLTHERRRMNTWPARKSLSQDGYRVIEFDCKEYESEDAFIPEDRSFSPHPFVPADASEKKRRCEEILSIQAMGLKKRLAHINAKSAVVGISGGLDSTLALIITVRAFDLLGIPRENITTVTMPGFGTTDRTYDNSCGLARCLGTTLREISIAESVRLHFKAIGQDESVHDVTYENAQARERTQILMDIANMTGGIVVGTGDMSELALGWATYNGDHMSMYGVNAGIPKTLIRHLVEYYADVQKAEGDERGLKLSSILYDVLDTPVSPELLPPSEGEISQKTEDLVGPYELHDFFLYYMLRYGFAPSKLYAAACRTFEGVYDEDTVKKWLATFTRRFFSQHYKRSCLPDGPKVGSIALSPRGDLRMPTDTTPTLWLT